jgi:hypothetical protein
MVGGLPGPAPADNKACGFARLIAQVYLAQACRIVGYQCLITVELPDDRRRKCDAWGDVSGHLPPGV